MNIIEAIKEFQTGKYEYMKNSYDTRLQYTISGTSLGFLMCNGVESWLHTSQLEGWEMGPKKKEKKTGWVTVYKVPGLHSASLVEGMYSTSAIFKHKEDAEEHAKRFQHEDVIPITWES